MLHKYQKKWNALNLPLSLCIPIAVENLKKILKLEYLIKINCTIGDVVCSNLIINF